MMVFVVLDDRAGDEKKVYVFDNHADALRCRRELRLNHWRLWGTSIGCYQSRTKRVMEITMPQDDCPKCHGSRWYQYDSNHSKPCEVCCKHDDGWWQLGEGYGEATGLWCCRAGCGTVRDNG